MHCLDSSDRYFCPSIGTASGQTYFDLAQGWRKIDMWYNRLLTPASGRCRPLRSEVVACYKCEVLLDKRTEVYTT